MGSSTTVQTRIIEDQEAVRAQGVEFIDQLTQEKIRPSSLLGNTPHGYHVAIDVDAIGLF